MPLILVSGYPSSGKTYRSRQLLSYLDGRINSSNSAHIHRLSVVVINDQSLGLSRDVYREARTEKDARAKAYAAVKRALGKDTVVIVDGLNYIKGFRYQMYCEAKSAGTGSCVVHVGTPIDKCREINKGLLESKESEGGYAEDVFENLIYRYEEPNGMTRWDSPLFTVPYEDETPPFEAIWEAMIGSEGKIKVVKPNRATLLAPATESDYLYDLDKTTQEVLNSILDWQRDHPGEGGGAISVAADITVELPANPVSLPQLQRHRRQFISMNRQLKLPKERIKNSFVEYLNDCFS
ncbi:hypothetical protein MMC24_003003 [Lignoscripta atroalba]|nr:hypothetical protein [Lignoscripta atroalba]